MKFLIWFVCCWLLFIINTIVYKAVGFRWGSIPITVMSIFLAGFLCRLYDTHRSKKRIQKIAAKAKAEGMDVKEYIYKDVPQRCIEGCESNRGKPKQLDFWLKYCVEQGKISKEARVYLFEEYRNNNREDKK